MAPPPPQSLLVGTSLNVD